MPIFNRETVTVKNGGERYSDSGDLTQFGAFVHHLEAGKSTSIKHWHAVEDEMVYVLRGTVVLHEGDESTVMVVGDCATFKAGAAAGHTFENTSDTTARLMVIGTRSVETETVTYPDHDRKLTFNRTTGERSWADHAGDEASNPYLDW